LALGYKIFDKEANVSALKRENSGKDLTFAGFIVFDSPLKRDTFKQIDLLKNANYRITMVTRDNELTATTISKQLKLEESENLQLENKSEKETLCWKDNNYDKKNEFAWRKTHELSKNLTLCINGTLLEYISSHLTLPEIKEIIQNITVFSRVSLSQKECIIHILQCVLKFLKQGICTLITPS